MPADARGGELIERRIPRSDESLPAVGLGTWQVFDVAGDAVGTEQARETLRAFAAGGGRVVDSSPMYGSSESVTGDLAAELGVAPRLFVATKVWITGAPAGIQQMEQSMRRLRVERFDLMQVHNLVDWREHLETLFAMKAAGEVGYIGITTSHGRRHELLERIMREYPLDFVQLTYNILDREPEERLLPLARDRGCCR